MFCFQRFVGFSFGGFTARRQLTLMLGANAPTHIGSALFRFPFKLESIYTYVQTNLYPVSLVCYCHAQQARILTHCYDRCQAAVNVCIAFLCYVYWHPYGFRRRPNN